MRSAVVAIKNRILPTSIKPRKIHFGLAKGANALVDFHYDTAFYFGTYETELNPHFRRLVPRGTRCFDVGGHRAWDAISLAVLSGKQVISFEANPSNIPFMNSTISASALDIRVVCKYVADVDNADSITLDRAMDEFFIPGFVKMDIEGAENLALRGAPRLLRDVAPAMIIEVHGQDVERECIDILRSAGYHPQVVAQKPRLFKEIRGDEAHNRWLICESPRQVA